MYTKKIGPTVLNIEAISKNHIELSIEYRKKVTHFSGTPKQVLINIKSLINSSSKHFNLIESYILSVYKLGLKNGSEKP